MFGDASTGVLDVESVWRKDQGTRCEEVGAALRCGAWDYKSHPPQPQPPLEFGALLSLFFPRLGPRAG